ncbi:hypothetical protein EDB19DRAFT_1194486 [Suillus lakei]|nr:hypothetical protein EDB19DRAFT_1194486 [Suillus lakei]
MATRLCENCHKKPKFGTHKYCGKTCAGKAATAQQPARRIQPGPLPKARVPPPAQKSGRLCDYCGQKPKFNNFDYCGKSCASKAATIHPAQPCCSMASGSEARCPPSCHCSACTVASSDSAYQTL